MRRDGGSVFPARANTGDPNGPVGGLSANEIARALISMMARSTTCSNQRPDTLMRDRICRIEENLLQRTAGPYIRVMIDRTQSEHNRSAFGLQHNRMHSDQSALAQGVLRPSVGPFRAGSAREAKNHTFRFPTKFGEHLWRATRASVLAPPPRMQETSMRRAHLASHGLRPRHSATS